MAADCTRSVKTASHGAPLVQAPWRGTGYFWALARDDRPWGGVAPPGVAFTYAPGRSGQYADEILQGFTGILQGEAGQQTVRGTVGPTNGYAGYNRLIQPDRAGPAIQLAYCWAHARRKLYEVARNSTAPIAEDGLRRIAEIYKIEAEIRGLPSEVRLAIHQDQSAPKIAGLKTWLTHHRARVSAKSPLGEALEYIAKYWAGLCVQGLARPHWGHGPLHSSPTVASSWTTMPSSAPSDPSP